MADPTVLDQAAVELRKFGNRMKGIIALADVLETMGSVENAALEASGRLEKLRGEEAALKASLEQVRLSIPAAHAEAEGIIQAAHKLAEEIAAEADAEIARCQADASKQIAADATAARKKISSLKAGIDKAEQRLAGLTADCDTRSATLSDLDTRIAGVKAQIAALG